MATVLRADDRTPWEEGEADLQSSECSPEEDPRFVEVEGKAPCPGMLIHHLQQVRTLGNGSFSYTEQN